jgi:hypothetical protein
MNRYFLNNILCLCIGALLFSCASQEILPPGLPDPETVEIHVPVTRTPEQPNNSDPDNKVVTARLFIIATNGKVLVNTKKDNQSGNTNIEFVETVTSGYAHWYIICNELSSWNFDTYSTGSYINITDIDSKIYNPTLYTNNHIDIGGGIPMASIRKNILISPSTISPEWGKVSRLIAKVTMDLRCCFNKHNNSGAELKLDSIKIMKMPFNSYLVPDFYQSNLGFRHGYNAYKASNLVPVISAQDSFHYKDTLYIPEYWVSNSSDFTYLSADLNLKTGGSQSTSKNYMIVISDGNHDVTTNTNFLAGTGSLSDLRITRNKQYEINAYLGNYTFGSDQEILLQATVKDWETSVTPDTIDERENTLIVSPEEITIPASVTNYSGVINITTDAKDGWSVKQPVTNVIFYSSTTNQPSGQLKFAYNGPTGSSATIEISADATKLANGSKKITKKVKITRQ